MQAAARREKDRVRKAKKRAALKADRNTQEGDATRVRMSQLRVDRKAVGNTQEADASQVRMSQLREDRKAVGNTQEADASQVRMSQLRVDRKAVGNLQEGDANRVRMSQLREDRKAVGNTQEADAKREARARVAACRKLTAIDFLDEFYANTVSRVNANSRLLDDTVGTPEYNSVVQDVLRDIKDFVFVGDDTEEKCRAAYMEAMEVEMKVCGTCGIRDPDLLYSELHLDQCISTDWIVVRPEALARLDALPPFELLRRNDAGELEIVHMHRRQFHNMYTRGDTTYHVIREAVLADRHGSVYIHVCPACAQARTHTGVPGLLDNHYTGSVHDAFDDLYYESNRKHKAF